MPQVTGIVKVFLNGTLQRSKEGASLSIGGFERTAQVGHSVYGYSEKPAPSEIEFTLAHLADTDLEELRDLVDATVRFETDTGVNFTIRKAFVTAPPKVTGGEGDVEVTMQGPPAVQELP